MANERWEQPPWCAGWDGRVPFAHGGYIPSGAPMILGPGLCYSPLPRDLTERLLRKESIWAI